MKIEIRPKKISMLADRDLYPGRLSDIFIRPDKCVKWCNVAYRPSKIILWINCDSCRSAILLPRTLADRKRAMRMPTVIAGNTGKYLCVICMIDIPSHTGNVCRACDHQYMRDYARAATCMWVAQEVFGRDIGGIITGYLARL